MLIVPLFVIAFFASQGALGRLYYYVITHNLMPSDDLWSLLIARTQDIRFWLFIFTLSGGWWLVKQDKNREIGLRRLFFFWSSDFSAQSGSRFGPPF